MEYIAKIAIIIMIILLVLFLTGCHDEPKNGWFSNWFKEWFK